MSEDEIAALDFDWKQFTPAEQAAFAFARKLTFEPQTVNDADLDQLRKHFTDMQILEMILSVAGNNQINRWKEGAGIPQSSSGGGFGRREGATPPPATPHSYLTPTSDKFRQSLTTVAPLSYDADGHPQRVAVNVRPALESREEVEQALAACRTRKPRLPLASETEAKALLQEDWPSGPLPQWVLLLANFPQDGKRRILAQKTADETTDALAPLMKARISWIVARQDRAWYATGNAYQRLKQLGQSDDQIFALDGSWDTFSPADRAMFVVARNLAASPIVLTDDDANEALKHFSPREVVQLISYTTVQASFDRITEAAGLPLEELVTAE